MAKGTTTIVTMTGFAEYARIFPGNMDDGDFHAKTQGSYNLNFYPEDNAGFEEYFKAGVPVASMGYDTIKIGNPELATGKYLKLKRPNVHQLVADWGGAPAVFDFREGLGMKKWDMALDGEVGNGSKVIAKVSVWTDGNKSIQRLEKIAVLELVEYDGSSQGSSVDMDNF
tara:strand:- start:1487 stop:1996 length:510 start_codon:yes stop_codon:yes gene_type:complete